MVEISDSQEKRLERKVIDRLSSTCAFSAIVAGTGNDADTPDVICVQDKKYTDYTRLIESDYDGKVSKDKQNELLRIADESGDNVKLEVQFRPSPRKVQGRTVKKEGWSLDKVESKLSEFDVKRKRWRD